MTQLPLAGRPGSQVGRGVGSLPLRRLRAVLLALLVTFGVTAAIFAAFGLSPLYAYGQIVTNSVGSLASLGDTLSVMGPLVLVGLAASIPFSAKLWNIGGQGQIYAGGVATILIALEVPGNAALVTVLAIIGGALGGAVWGAIPGVLRGFFGISEVIVTLMLNFLGVLLASYVMTKFGSGLADATRTVRPGIELPVLWSSLSIDTGFVLTIVLALLTALVYRHFRIGLLIRATGANADAVWASGARSTSIVVGVMVAGGAFAGLSGSLLVLGSNHALVAGMDNNYGLLGVAVALIARLQPLWVVVVSFFAAAITVGTNNLAVLANIPSAVSLIIQGVFVLLVLAAGAVRGNNA